MDEGTTRARTVAATYFELAPETLTTTSLVTRRRDRLLFVVGTPGRPTVVAKCYATAAQTRSSAERLAAFEPLATDDGRIEVPRLLAADPEQRVVLMTHLQGTGLDELLRGPEAGGWAERLGALLARVHGSGVPLTGSRSRWELLERAEAARLNDADVALGAAAVARARALLSACPVEPVVPSHGDLGPGQALGDGDRIALLDFDRAMLAEPAYDLGYLAAHLWRDHGARGADLWACARDGYRRLRPLPDERAVVGCALLVLVRKLARSTAPRPQATIAVGEETRRVSRATRTRPAIERLLEMSGRLGTSDPRT